MFDLKRDRKEPERQTDVQAHGQKEIVARVCGCAEEV
jgi:hypothetical protein